MRYSFSAIKDKSELVFAQKYNINASYKDLCAVCDAIRYMRSSDALALVEKVANKETPVLYRRHSKHLGARHELGGRKGRYPSKAAKEVRDVLINAISNASNKAMDGDEMVVVHASANKTRIERRYPSKGTIAWGRGTYGRSATMHSDIEYAKIEIGLADAANPKLTGNMKYFIKKKIVKHSNAVVPQKPKAKEPKKSKKTTEAIEHKKEEPKTRAVESSVPETTENKENKTV